MDRFSPLDPTIDERPRYRPPIGIPMRDEPRAQATVAAVLLHAFIVLLVLAPTLLISSRLLDAPQPLGAGGKGPAGGGGGGSPGASSVRFTPEKLRYVQLPSATPPKPQEVKPPVPTLKPPPVEKKPEPVKPPPAETTPVAAPVDSGSANTSGTGAGTKNDGTNGAGPGSGGGVGSGEGTGRGSGNGPGTGGGDDAVYPPAVVALPILPLPVPARVRPYRMVAQFEVDSTGSARLLNFNPSRDAGYNRRIREMLMEIRFRPAVRPDGRPVRAIAVITAEAM